MLFRSNDVKLEPCELGKNSDPLPALLMAALLPLFYMWTQGWWRCGRVWCPRPGTKLFPPPDKGNSGLCVWTAAGKDRDTGAVNDHDHRTRVSSGYDINSSRGLRMM